MTPREEECQHCHRNNNQGDRNDEPPVMPAVAARGQRRRREVEEGDVDDDDCFSPPPSLSIAAASGEGNTAAAAISVSTTALPQTATLSSASATSTVDGNNDSIVRKEQPPSMSIPQSALSSNSDTATSSNHSHVGAHQINESAPNINRRLFSGLTNRNARMRAREERRIRRENRENSNNHDDGNDGESTSHQLRLSMISSHSSSSSSNAEQNAGHYNTNHPSILSRTTTPITATLVEDDNVVVAEAFAIDDDVIDENYSHYNKSKSNNQGNNIKSLPDSQVGRIISRLEYRNNHRVAVSNDAKNRFLRLCHEACLRRVEIMREASMIDDEHEQKVEEEEEKEDGSVASGVGGRDRYSQRSSSGRSSDNWRSNNSSCNSSSRGNVSHSRRGSEGNRNSESGYWGSNSSINGLDTTQLATKTKSTNGGGLSLLSPRILREDVMRIRNTIRLTVESRTKFQQFQSNARSFFGFKCNDEEVLLQVLNRAVDSIDESGHAEAMKRRRIINSRGAASTAASTTTCSFGAASSSIMSMPIMRSHWSNSNGSYESLGDNNPSGMMLRADGVASFDNSNRSYGSQQLHDEENNDDGSNEINDNNINDEESLDWFYYKDFAFYNLKVESRYPWVRNAGMFSVMVTLTFFLFTPVLWCVSLRDENICPSQQGSYNGWLTSLYFASATMSTVGYGEVTVLVNHDDFVTSPYPQNWRIFIATIYMILSLVVFVVGFQAGLDSHFHPFRRRLVIFGKRVCEILREANIVKEPHDKHEVLVRRMRFVKFSRLAEICLIFLILNLVGVFAVRLSLLGEEKEEFPNLSWMESLYWSVQTTTTIGYGDVEVPQSLRWFMIFYLSISTFFLGSAFGKLGELSKKLDSMQRLYLWQQQEATYTMLADYSGRPENESGRDSVVDQYEFTIASLVLLGKITSEDVRPILEKFAKLSGESNNISAADVSSSIKKKKEVVTDADDTDEKRLDAVEDEPKSPRQSSSGGALSVTRKIAQAFREELFSSTTVDKKKENVDKEESDDVASDYSRFRIPTNTHAIAIDDSKIQRKLLSKFFEFAGIPEDRVTIVGDGHDEVMGFEDFVVNFMENHPEDFVFLLVDENLDVVDDNSIRTTISGSLSVENIRIRLPAKLERRMFALVRSANDSSSDRAIYRSRAHGFLPKAPIKCDKVLETLAPLWIERFPPSEFGETIGLTSNDEIMTAAVACTPYDNVACTPYDIAQQIDFIESLFKGGKHVSNIRMIHEQMHGLKGDLLTLNCTVSVTSMIGNINLILVAQSPETMVERWKTLRDQVKEILNTMQRNFRVPKNTYAIAIDDSKIQRKLLAKFFDFMDIPAEQCTILGDGADEIKGFEDFVVTFMKNHKNDYVFVVVDENLDVMDESSDTNESISGSVCVENIRKRLSYKLERRLFALVRSANDSSSDVDVYNVRAHGFLPKAPIRRENVNETLAPLWLKRFPRAQFGDSVAYDNSDESASTVSEVLACSTQDIVQKLGEIDARFDTVTRSTNWRRMHDQLHELKGDILTMTSDASMISILGMINLLLSYKDSSLIAEKWPKLRDRIYSVINNIDERKSSSTAQASGRRWGNVRASALKRRTPLSNSFKSATTEISDLSIVS